MHRIIEDQQELARWVRAQKGPTDIAVAFWGDKALDHLGIDGERSIRVLLDLTAGATNPNVVAELIRLAKKGNVQVRKLDRLHAKAYIGRGEMVVGSANASANGLGAEGFEATHWKELCLLTDDSKAIAQARVWFKKQWDASQPIKPADVDLARNAWKKRRRQRPEGRTRDLLEIAIRSPYELEGRDFYINVVTERMDRVDEKELKKMGEEAGHTLYGFTHWPSIPINVTMMSFTDYDGRTISGVSFLIGQTPGVKKRSKFKLVTPTTFGGYESGDLHRWKRRIRYYRAHNAESYGRNGGLCMPIVDFVYATSATETV